MVTYKRIIAAGVALAKEEKSPFKVSMRATARKAEVSASTVFKYFCDAVHFHAAIVLAMAQEVTNGA